MVVFCVFKCCCFSSLVQEVLSFIYLDRESLRLLGLRDLDLDLERDLPPPRPSSYNLILTMCHLIFCSKRSTTSHSLHSMILSKYQMVCPPTNNILLVQYLQILPCLSHILTFDHPVQRHRACQERTPCRPCWQTQPLLHQSCEDKIEDANFYAKSYRSCSHDKIRSMQILMFIAIEPVLMAVGVGDLSSLSHVVLQVLRIKILEAVASDLKRILMNLL